MEDSYFCLEPIASHAEKRARADFVIPTDVSLGETRAAVMRVIACVQAGQRR